MDNLKFSALLCSRICHDLASPVGAINNGVEMLGTETDPAMVVQITDLIKQSAAQTSNRIQFYRLAFGAASAFGPAIRFDLVKESIEPFLSDQQIDLRFDPGEQAGGPAAVKLLCNLTLILAETIMRGGRLRIELADKSPGVRITLTAEAERLILQENIRQALSGSLDESELDPRAIPAALALEVASAIGTNIELLEAADGSLSLGFELAEMI